MKNNNNLTYILIAVVVVIALFGLYQSTNAPGQTTQSVEDVQAGYIWLSLDQAAWLAKEQWVPFRVVSIDGEPQIVTMDYVVGRINASIVDGKITDFSFEGE